jgi:hypothetical protein
MDTVVYAWIDNLMGFESSMRICYDNGKGIAFEESLVTDSAEDEEAQNEGKTEDVLGYIK